MDYASILKRIEAFEIATSRESLAHSVGHKKELQIAPIYEKYADLFEKKNITWARARHDAMTGGPARRAASYLLDFFINGFIGNKLKHLGDEESTYEASANVTIEGKDVPFRQVSNLVQNEENRKKRKAMVNACKPVKKKLTQYEKKMLATHKRMLTTLSGKDYVAYYAEHKDCDLDALGSKLRGFLVRTDALHSKLLAKRLATIKVTLAQAEAHDYSVILRTKHYDKKFSKEGLFSALTRTLHGMNIDIKTQKNVHVDLEDRPTKVPRAFCSPIRIPEEIHLVLKPRGGQQDYQTLLHEAGHTEHFAHTDAALPYELKHMGGHAVSETYAFLFEYLTISEAWLTDVMNMPKEVSRAFLQELLEQKLFMFRRYSAKLLYELKLHRNDLTMLNDTFEPIPEQHYASMSACYTDILTKATKTKYPKDNWLLDVDGGFYSCDYLRAWMLEAALRRTLETRFGKQWYHSADAGDYLKELWSSGSNGRNINELAGHIGVDLDTKAIEIDFARLER